MVTASRELIGEALVATQAAAPEHPMLARAMAGRLAMQTLLEHLREFGANASHEDLLAEIDSLYREARS